jgi:LCP family protein required for cell wall assembly
MRVSPASRRRSRGPLIWLILVLACGVGAMLLTSLMGQATQGLEGGVAGAQPLTRRANVLLLGIDQRAGMSDPARTDTLLLLSLDPATHTAGLLSLNRDVWVPLPGLDRSGKINTAHFIGETEHYPGGGPALAMKAVQATLDVPVSYYVRLNFSAFEKLIDLVGGIDVLVAAPIDDPDYPDAGFGYEPFYIGAGWQHLDGATALKYARTRATPGSDLDRVKRQQQVIMAVRDKIVKNQLLPHLLTQIGPVLQTLGGSLQTNLTPGQLVELAQLAAQIERDQIQTVTLGGDQVEAFITPDGQEALRLKPGAVEQLRAQLYHLPVTAAPPTMAAVAPSAATATVRATPTLSPPATTLTPAEPRRHVVEMGDTLFALAQRYGVTVEAIIQANQLTGDDIYAGQQLIIP